MGVHKRKVVLLNLLGPADLARPLRLGTMSVRTPATTRLPLLAGSAKRLTIHLAQLSLVKPYPSWLGPSVVALGQCPAIRVSPFQKVLPLHLNFFECTPIYTLIYSMCTLTRLLPCLAWQTTISLYSFLHLPLHFYADTGSIPIQVYVI